MHPLASAYLKLQEIRDLNIRQWSPYYGQWLAMLDEQWRVIAELEQECR